MNKIIKTKNYQQVLIWILSLTFIFSLLNVRSRGRGGGPELRTMSEVYQFSLKSVAPKDLHGVTVFSPICGPK